MSGWIGRQSDIVHYFWLNWGAAVCESGLRGKTANPATAAKRGRTNPATAADWGAGGDLALRGNAGKAQQAQAKRGWDGAGRAARRNKKRLGRPQSVGRVGHVGRVGREDASAAVAPDQARHFGNRTRHFNRARQLENRARHFRIGARQNKKRLGRPQSEGRVGL